mmetsp:Transcript_1107/g.1256  ORF Transcript_1107/g.1256 Transcript_1107/m.1256 type:complete len:170 (+) Transcript_1107:71-580(+)
MAITGNGIRKHTISERLTKKASLQNDLLRLLFELQLDIIDLDVVLRQKWPELSKRTATTTRFDGELRKHGKWLRENCFTRHLVQQQTFSHGKLHGENKLWYSSGQLEELCFYVEGKLEGGYTAYHENGQLLEKANYVNDELVGDSCTFNDLPTWTRFDRDYASLYQSCV